jgi:hypothetical protein
MTGAVTRALSRPWVALAIAGYLAVLLGLFLLFPPSPDDAVYDYIGWIVGNGGTAYVDAADQNWPGMVFLHTLSTLAFGNTLYSYRALDILMLVATTALMAAFLRRYVGSLAAILVWPLYPTMYAAQNRWLVGQRDIVVFPILLLAAWSQMRRLEGGSARLCIGQGLWLACAALMRPTFLAMAGLLALADLGLRRSHSRSVSDCVRDQSIVLASLLAGLGLAALGGLASGALAEWWNTTVRFNLEVYSAGAPGVGMLDSVRDLLHYWGWLMAISAWGVWVVTRAHREAAGYLGLIAATALVSFLVQRKGFGYHLGTLYPLIAIFAAPAVAWALTSVSRRTGARHLRTIAAAALLVVISGGLARKCSRNLWPEILWVTGNGTRQEVLASADTGEDGFTLADAVDLSDYVRTQVPRDGRFLFWGRPSIINYLAGRRSPTRFASFALVAAPRPSFSLFAAWQQELADGLERTPPQLVCLLRDPSGSGYAYLPAPTPGQPLIGDVLARKLDAAYLPDRSFGSADCFRARSDS